MLAFEHDNLLTQGHDLESKAISRAKESSEPFKETPHQFEHRASLHGPVVTRGYVVDHWFLNAMKFWRQTGLVADTERVESRMDRCLMLLPTPKLSSFLTNLPRVPALQHRGNS
jgi:hypothetical protein